MQDINNKLADLLDGLTSFFEQFVDDMVEVTANENHRNFPSADH